MPILIEMNFLSREFLKLKGMGGEELHSLFFNFLKLSDENIAKQIHDQRRMKPFSIFYNLKGDEIIKDGFVYIKEGNTLSFIFSLLDDNITDLFFEGFKKFLSLKRDFKIKGKRVELREMRVIKRESYEDLMNAEFVSKNIKLEFLTPTSFRIKNYNFLFPLPFNVYNSLLKRWNIFSPYKFDEGLKKIFDDIKVKCYELKTELVEFKDYRIIGFKGSVEYELPENNKEIYTLSRYAEYSGVGYKTTMGLGRVKLI